MGLLDEEEQYRVNAFDWHKCFAEVFKTSGGFDAVIGNPPYIRIQTLKEWAPMKVEFYKKAYASASKGNYDIYVVFVEKGLSLLNEKGGWASSCRKVLQRQVRSTFKNVNCKRQIFSRCSAF